MLIVNTSNRGELSMHGCVQCAAMLIVNTSIRGERIMHGCAQCAVMLILNISRRGELIMHRCVQCTMMLTLNISHCRFNVRIWYMRRGVAQESFKSIAKLLNPSLRFNIVVNSSTFCVDLALLAGAEESLVASI
jgi:hypothetical protein